MCKPGAVHHHSQQYIHNPLLLGIRQPNIAKCQRQNIEEFTGIKLDQCPQMRVDGIIDGTGRRMQSGQTVQNVSTNSSNTSLWNVTKWIRSSSQTAADVHQDLVTELHLKILPASVYSVKYEVREWQNRTTSPQTHTAPDFLYGPQTMGQCHKAFRLGLWSGKFPLGNFWKFILIFLAIWL